MEHEETYLGPLLDDAVTRARRRLRVGVDPDYDLVRENFDVRHYLLQRPALVDRPLVDPVKHYLASDPEEVSPHPDFSTTSYLRRHPEVAGSPEADPYLHWLRHGRAAGHIADPAPAIEEMSHILGRQPAEVVDLLVERRRDVRERLLTGELGRVVAKAAEIEPLIAQAHTRFSRPRLLPFGDPTALKQVAVVHGAQEAAQFRRARLVLVINRPRWGGGRRLEGHVVHALMGDIAPEDVVVVYTEDAGTAPEGRFPAGVREVDFASLAGDLEREDAGLALVLLLRTFHADAIVNLNSATFYAALRVHGRALHVSERVFLCFFCNEFTRIGAWTGWSLRYFYRLFDQVSGVITDSEDLARQLQETHRVPPEDRTRMHVLRAPVDDSLPRIARPPDRSGGRPQVFWAGRWDRQKRVGLLVEIARAMPDVDFHAWGEAVLDRSRGPVPSNVVLEGRYDHISHVPLGEADAWLYTSGWDGVPSQLLEVGMTGIPIVGTLVGGTGEVLRPGMSWPVPVDAGADRYAAAIRTILDDPTDARRRALELRDWLAAERTADAFAAQVRRLLLVTEEEKRRTDDPHPGGTP